MGKGASRGKLKRMYRDLKSSVVFLGFRRDVPDILHACDALVSPTRYEAYGLNVHEAICCGLPAMVSALAGIAERYPKALEDLLIPDPENVQDIAERIRACEERSHAIQGGNRAIHRDVAVAHLGRHGRTLHRGCGWNVMNRRPMNSPVPN